MNIGSKPSESARPGGVALIPADGTG